MNDATQVGSVPSGNRNATSIRHDRTLEIAVGLRGGNGEKERGAALVLLKLSLLERGNDKRCVPDTASRREPL